MTQTLRRLPTLVLALLLAACASGSGGSSGGGGSNMLNAQDLEQVQNLSAYDAIQRLRPQWLQVRANNPPPRVIMNGSPMGGGPEMLRSVQVSDLTSIRYRNGRDATTRYGTGYGGGAIELNAR